MQISLLFIKCSLIVIIGIFKGIQQTTLLQLKNGKSSLLISYLNSLI